VPCLLRSGRRCVRRRIVCRGDLVPAVRDRRSRPDRLRRGHSRPRAKPRKRILLGAVLRPNDVSVSNTHFDTTRAGVEASGATARDFPVAKAQNDGFGGDIDLGKVERLHDSADGAHVHCLVLTITNNAGGGQPVSMEDIASARRLCDCPGISLLLDASRLAEKRILHHGARSRTRRNGASRSRAHGVHDGAWVLGEPKEGRPGQHRRADLSTIFEK
jgi:hypothetical protein